MFSTAPTTAGIISCTHARGALQQLAFSRQMPATFPVNSPSQNCITKCHYTKWMTKHKPRVKFLSPLAKAQHSKFHLIVCFCPSSFRKTAFISLVRSALKYSTAVWDPYQQNDIDNLESTQRCAARFINHNYNYWVCHQHAERPRTAAASK